jgi:hypothetical protein
MPLPQQTSDIVSGPRLVTLTAWSLLTLVCCATCLAYLLSGLDPHVLLHAALFVTGLLITYSVIPGEDARSVIAAFVMAYLLRVLMILALHQLGHGGLLLLDDKGYDEQARFLASDFSVQAIQSAAAKLGTLHTGYPILLAAVYRYVGYSILSAKLLNATFGALCVPVTYHLTAELTDKRSIAVLAAWVCCLFLYDVGWSAYLMKDTFLLLLFSTTILIGVRLARSKRLILLVVASALLFAINFFRMYATAVAIAAAVFACAIELGRRTGRNRTARLLKSSAIVVGITLLSAKVFRSSVDSFQTVALYSETLDNFDSTGFKLLHFSLTPGFFIGVLRASIVYLLGPFAWILSHVPTTEAIFYPGMYIVYFLLPFFLIGFMYLFCMNSWAATFVLLCYVFHAATEIYMYQSGERQRMMTDIIFIVCAALGWEKRKEHTKVVLCTYGCLVLLALVQSATNI